MRFLSTNDAAKMLAVTPCTMRHWRAARTGPAFYKDGRRALYSDADLRDFVAANYVRHETATAAEIGAVKRTCCR